MKELKKKRSKVSYFIIILLAVMLLVALLAPSNISSMLASFIAQDLRIAIPLALAAVGLVFNERAGVNNIGAEGMMLVGALATWMGAAAVGGNPWLGAVIGMIAGALIGLLFAFLTITLRSNQIVIGIAINMLALGATSTIYRVVSATTPQGVGFPTISFGFLSGIPRIGPFLNTVLSQSAMVYIAIALVLIFNFVLMKTDLGLKVRGVGENPRACDTVGINVFKIRYGAVIFGGLMSGLAGAVLVLDVKVFAENMTAGKGFIALAAVIFGKFSVIGAFGASLVFGAAEAVQYLVKALGAQLPNDLVNMLPYLVTILALAGFIGKTRVPAASTKPYTKE